MNKVYLYFGILFLSIVVTVRSNDDCGGIIDESEGLVVYNYNKPFPKESCLWTFTSRNGSNLGALEFSLLTHGFTPEDYFDSLTFFYIATNGSIIHSGSLNAERRTPIVVDSRVAFMSFAHYNHAPSNKATGFILQFKGVSSKETDGNTIIRNTGRFYADLADNSIKSFKYPAGKDDWNGRNEYATFVIHNKDSTTGTGGRGVNLRIENVQMLGRCSNDALMLYTIRDNGYDFNWPEIGTICSTGPTYNISVKPGRSVIAVFRSNDDYQYDDNLFTISWD